MPGFNRYDPPSPSLASEDGSDSTYLLDADQIFDKLPQPFRRIDKVLWEIFNAAWDVIEQHQVERDYKKSIKKDLEKVVYEKELLVSEKVSAVCASDAFLFLGTSEGRLRSYTIPDLTTAGSFQLECGPICRLECVAESTDCAVILVQDKEGHVLIVGFKANHIKAIQNVSNSDSKSTSSISHGVFVSPDKDFLAVDWSESFKHHVDVYKLPKEQWLTQVMNMKSVEELAAEQSAISENELVPGDASEVESSINQSLSSSLLSPNPSSAPKREDSEFSKVIHVMTLRPPVVMPCTATSIMSAMRNINPESNVIGTGMNHILTPLFFENLLGVQKHQLDLKDDNLSFSYLSSSTATCHFLKGQIASSLFPMKKNRDMDASSNAIAIWWQHGNQILIYSLEKGGKDIDHKPISVLPHADSIKLTAVNKQTDLIASALVNNCISVWNRYTGQSVAVVKPEENVEIIMIQLPSVFYGTLETRLIYLTNNGKLWQMTCERNSLSNLICLDDRSSHLFPDDIGLSSICEPRNLLSVIWKSGNVVIYNEASRTPLCQLEIFNEDSGFEWNGDQIFMVYSQKNILLVRDESVAEGKTCSRVFIFDANEHAILQPFFYDLMNTSESDQVDNLQKYFVSFVKDRRLSEESLKTKIESGFKELLNLKWTANHQKKMISA